VREVSDVLAKLHTELQGLGKAHAGPTRTAIEKIDARVAPLVQSLGGLARSDKAKAITDFSELGEPLQAIRADIEALKRNLPAADHPPIDVLLSLVDGLLERIASSEGKPGKE
jgi:hypothetical protein